LPGLGAVISPELQSDVPPKRRRRDLLNFAVPQELRHAVTLDAVGGFGGVRVLLEQK
jgi:hypothetical protein